MGGRDEEKRVGRVGKGGENGVREDERALTNSISLLLLPLAIPKELQHLVLHPQLV